MKIKVCAVEANCFFFSCLLTLSINHATTNFFCNIKYGYHCFIIDYYKLCFPFFLLLFNAVIIEIKMCNKFVRYENRSDKE